MSCGFTGYFIEGELKSRQQTHKCVPNSMILFKPAKKLECRIVDKTMAKLDPVKVIYQYNIPRDLSITL